MPVILNFAPDEATIAELPSCAFLVVISAKTQFLDQVKVNCTSHLISGIFKLLQKLFKCLRSSKYLLVLTSFRFVSKSLFSGVFSVIIVLYLKDSELEERRLLHSSL